MKKPRFLLTQIANLQKPHILARHAAKVQHSVSEAGVEKRHFAR